MLINRTHFSLLEAVSKPKDLVKRVKELGYTACSINDYGSISGCIEFYNACKENNIKPLLGVDLNVDGYWLTLIAKNKIGWQKIIKMVSLSNKNYQGRPILSFNQLIPGHCVVISGHKGSLLGGQEFLPVVGLLKEKYNNIYFSATASNNYTEKCKLSRLKPVAILNSHYLTPKDQDLHNVILSVGNKIPIDQLKETPLADFYYNNNFYIKSVNEMKNDGISQEAIDNMQEVVDLCEDYDILSNPKLPKFKCPNGLTSSEYLLKLCRQGYREKILETEKHKKAQVYADRIKEEEEIFTSANLADYFLITADMLNYVRENGGIIGPGRGSSAGCLISYLLNITDIDPIEHNLLLERFFNKGRMSEGHISLPDIDSDIPKNMRENVIEHLKEKYGNDKVGHVVSYQTMMGRNALKSVFRAYETISFDEMNRITENIYDKAKIADKLQEMDNPSVILWALQNKSDKFMEWCHINNSDEIVGDLAKEFKLAIELEGTKVAQSKHAAGIIISVDPLENVCPMVWDEHDKQTIVGWEYVDAEATGLMKCDILGLSTLDRMMDISNLVNI